MEYPLTYDTWGPEEFDAIQSVVNSKRFTMGPRVKEFEDNFSSKYQSKYAVMVNSGSSANLISIASLFYKKDNPLKRGDEVIVPAISWSTTYYPLMQYGLKLRFIDVDPNTLNMDVSLLKDAMTENTRAIVAVNILGNPCELNILSDFCKNYNLYLFEDNCESMGAELNGKACGTFGDIGTFSTFYSHHISTMEGGMILTDNEELYHLCLALRAHGWTRDLPSETKIFQRKSEDFFEAYRFIVPGYNVRPLEMSGAVGVEQLKKVDRMIEIRRDNANYFKDFFAKDKRFRIQKENGKSSCFSFTLIIEPNQDMRREKVLNTLKEHHIQYRIITGGNFIKHDVIKYFNYDIVGGSTPHANYAHDMGFFVGNFPFPAKEHINYLHNVLTKI